MASTQPAGLLFSAPLGVCHRHTLWCKGVVFVCALLLFSQIASIRPRPVERFRKTRAKSCRRSIAGWEKKARREMMMKFNFLRKTPERVEEDTRREQEITRLLPASILLTKVCSRWEFGYIFCNLRRCSRWNIIRTPRVCSTQRQHMRVISTWVVVARELKAQRLENYILAFENFLKARSGD